MTHLPRRYSRRALLSRGTSGAAAVVLGALGAPSLLSGCASTRGGLASARDRPGIGTGPPVRGGTIKVAMSSEVNGFLPTKAHYDGTGYVYANTVYDPLAVIDARGNWRPYLAQSIVPNPEYGVWTVTLRPGVVFHDDSPLTANVVIANLKAQMASVLGKPALGFVSALKATGPLSFTIELFEPAPQLPYALTQQVGYVAAMSQLESGDTTKPVGTGPFRFVSWVPNQSFVVERNPSYWRGGLPYLDGITFLPIANDQARQSALSSGQVELMVSRNVAAIGAFGNSPSYQQVTVADFPVGEPSVDFVALNCGIAPTNDPIVRQALAYAIDRQQLLALFGSGVSVPTSSPFFSSSSFHAPDNDFPGYDLARAQLLVRQAKAAHGGAIAVDLATIPDPSLAPALQALQQMWSAAGITTTVTQIQQAALIDNLLLGSFQAILMDEFGAPDPDANNYFWNGANAAAVGHLALNFTRNKDPLVDEALEVGRISANPQIRSYAYQTLDRQFAKDLPFLWLRQSPFTLTGADALQNFAGPTAPDDGSPLQGLAGDIFNLVEAWKAA